MYLKIRKFFALTFVLVFLVSLFPFHLFAQEPVLFISEVQTGGCSTYDLVDPTQCDTEDSSEEFIELYNPQNIELDVTNWKVQYLSATGATVSDLAVLNGILYPQSYLLLSHEGYFIDITDIPFSKTIAKSGGHIRVVDNNGEIVDLIGWGSANATGLWPKSSEIPPGYSVKRILPTDPLYETGIVYTTPTLPVNPQGGGYLSNPDSPPDGGMGGGVGGGQNSCSGIIITEILPNPSGSDTGNEFIELYNPTSNNISLEACQLETGAKTYTFGKIELKPKQYKAFYNDITGLTLTNSSGGNVYLLSPSDINMVELQDIKYQSDLEDDVAWAFDLSKNTWSITYSPTPGTKNTIVEVRPCPEGQFRNLETNRCNNIVIEAGLGPCPAGKFRNPETNRCKNILDASSQLNPCGAGQFRNPATNRCKSLVSSRSLVPCKPDQERNPETNRCRKITGLSSDSDDNNVKDVLSVSQAQGKTGWAMAGFSFAGASAYAIWEWRREMLEKLSALKSKLGIK